MLPSKKFSRRIALLWYLVLTTLGVLTISIGLLALHTPDVHKLDENFTATNITATATLKTNTGASEAFGGDLDMQSHRINNALPFDDTHSGVVPASGGGTLAFLRADHTWAVPPSGTGTVNTTAPVVGDGSVGNPLGLSLSANFRVNTNALDLGTTVVLPGSFNSTAGTNTIGTEVGAQMALSTTGTINDLALSANVRDVVYIGAAGATLNGMTAGLANQRIRFTNESAFNAVFNSENSGETTPANRYFVAGATSYTLPPKATVEWVYDSTDGRWILSSQMPAAPSCGAGQALASVNPDGTFSCVATSTGSLSGTLTAKKMPVASGPTTLVDSDITDDQSTHTITIDDPANTDNIWLGSTQSDYTHMTGPVDLCRSCTHLSSFTSTNTTINPGSNTGLVNIGTAASVTGGIVIGSSTNPTTINDTLTQVSIAANEAAQLSTELLSSTGWTSTGWTGSWGAGWTHTTGNTTALVSTLTDTSGAYYQITFTVTGRTTGTFTVALGATTSGSYSASGGFGPASPSTNASLTITPTTDFNGTIVLSVKQITGDSTATYAIQDSAAANNFEIRSYTDGENNLGVGLGAGAQITTASGITAVGYQALNTDTTGINNVAVGYQALLNESTASSNVAVGYQALVADTTGFGNVAVGANTLASTTTATYNIGIGYLAVHSASTNGSNVGVGFEADYGSTGAANTAVGYAALTASSSSTMSAAFGYEAMINATASQNTAIGAEAMFGLTTGSSNTALGYQAGYKINGGAANAASTTSVYLGAFTDALASGDTNETVIGYNAVGNGSNTVTLGNTSVTDLYINGKTHLAAAGITGLPVNSCGAGSFVSAIDTTGTATCTAQAAGIGGSGTAGKIPKWATNTTLTDSDIDLDTGSVVGFFTGGTEGPYLTNNSLNFGYSYAANNLTSWINFNGASNGTTFTRNLTIGNGQEAAIATFTASNKSVTTFGWLQSGGQIYSDNSAAGAAIIGGNGLSCSFGVAATSTCHINAIGYNDTTGQFRILEVDDGKGTGAGHEMMTIDPSASPKAVTNWADTVVDVDDGGVTGNMPIFELYNPNTSATLHEDKLLFFGYDQSGTSHTIDILAIPSSGQFTVEAQLSVTGPVSASDLTASNAVMAVHIGGDSGTPTITSCGTSPTVTGNDVGGTFTTGTGTVTDCTINFNTAYSNVDECMVVGAQTGAPTPTMNGWSTSAFHVHFAANAAALIYSYHCDGH